MSVAYDATTVASEGASVTSVSFSHTASGSDRHVRVGFGSENFPSSGALTITTTYDGTSMTLLETDFAAVAGNAKQATLFGSASGQEPASTSKTVSVSFGGATVYRTRGNASSFNGVDTTTPSGTAAKANGTTLSPTVTVTSTTSGNMISDIVIDITALTAAETPVMNVNFTSGGASAGTQYVASPGGSKAMAWTSAFTAAPYFAIVACEILAAGGGGGGGSTGHRVIGGGWGGRTIGD